MSGYRDYFYIVYLLKHLQSNAFTSTAFDIERVKGDIYFVNNYADQIFIFYSSTVMYQYLLF